MDRHDRVAVSQVHHSNDEAVNAVFERLATKSVGIVNLHRTLAHAPALFDAFIGFAHALRFDTKLDPAERELAILRVLALHGGEYEIVQHRKLGTAAGLSTAQLDAACGIVNEDDLSPRERTVLAFATAFAKGEGVSQTKARQIEAVLDERGRVELSVTLALYTGLAHMTATLGIPHD